MKELRSNERLSYTARGLRAARAESQKHAPGDPTMEKCRRKRRGGKSRERRRSKWDGRGSHQQHQWVQSQPHGISAAPAHAESDSEGRGEKG